MYAGSDSIQRQTYVGSLIQSFSVQDYIVDKNIERSR